MRFPYKRSVGQDLRDLFQVERLSSQARTLAHSSMRQGEGAVRFLNADGTAALAILGDLPGGGYGVGIPNGAGGFVSIQDHVAAKFAALRATDIPTNSGATVQADLTYLGGQTTLLSNRITNLTAAQVASGSAGGNVQSDLTYLGQQTASATSRLNSLNASQVASGSAGGTVQLDLTYLGQQASSASTRLGSAESSIGGLASSVGSLVGRMAAVELKNGYQDDALAQAAAQRTDMQNQINVLRDRINRGGIPM